ncbi:hypothetical protein [uncultured Methanobrevibacter sp.]|nr:hypothetical protein [uncultured Methanobrevibacter sp.]
MIEEPIYHQIRPRRDKDIQAELQKKFLPPINIQVILCMLLHINIC